MAKNNRRKLRAEFRKHHQCRTRRHDLTRDFQQSDAESEAPVGERVSGKGELTRKRTVYGVSTGKRDDAVFSIQLDIDSSACLAGRVLSVHGLTSVVCSEHEGSAYRCTTRGLLKTLTTDQRHVVAAGDRVWFRPEGSEAGLIERIEPRRGVLSRAIRGRRHVIVANVDQLLIVSSAAEPVLKPNLIDRMIVTAEKAGIKPVICINKIDLVDPADLQPLVGVYAQLGYTVLLLSARTSAGVAQLRRLIAERESVVAGQSGVGKSSLLNAIEPGLDLKIAAVSAENQKGKHTTTTARLIPLAAGGFVVDTPGVRQFQLWDVIPQEVGGYYRDIRPYVSLCRFPDCTHMHEADCAVKDAVADGHLDVRRYESYCQVFAGE